MPYSSWMSGGAIVIAAAAMGVGLGSYATSGSGRSAADTPVEPFVEEQPAIDHFAAMDTVTRPSAPVEIHCTGCGPTLAERRWRADMASWDAGAYGEESRDPVVRDYGPRDEEDTPPAQSADLPVRPARFASHDAVRDGGDMALSQDLSPSPTMPGAGVAGRSIPARPVVENW